MAPLGVLNKGIVNGISKRREEEKRKTLFEKNEPAQ
jgi:hypothetical protein